MSDSSEYNNLQLDNARVLHMLLLPFRILRYLGIFGAVVVVVVLGVGMGVYNRVAWRWNRGTESMAARQELVKQIEADMRTDFTSDHVSWAVFDVNFVYREAMSQRERFYNWFIEDQFLTLHPTDNAMYDVRGIGKSIAEGISLCPAPRTRTLLGPCRR